MLHLALLSGALGAAASCLGKFALSPDSTLTTTKLYCDEHLDFSGDVCTALSWIPRGICLIVMILMNALMVGSFLEGMDESGSVAGTGLATAANFVVAAILGALLWDESIHIGGFCLVLFGALLLSGVKLEKQPKEKDE